MGESEFLAWQIYDRIEPFGAVRGDLQAGIIASVLGNLLATPDRALMPHDFILRMEDDGPGGLDEETALAKVAQLNALFGGQDLRADEHNR